jgi:hypothetical protein
MIGICGKFPVDKYITAIPDLIQTEIYFELAFF